MTERNPDKRLPSFDALYAFLKARYRTDRFEGRNGAWCQDYSRLITQGALEHLELRGSSCIGHFEAGRGDVIWYDASLEEISYEDAAAIAVAWPEDRNHGRSEDAIASHHESAQTMAKPGAASGISVQPGLFEEAT